ncbi:MAG: TrkH family potassium uptake protein [Hyphomicrobiales bacterium]
MLNSTVLHLLGWALACLTGLMAIAGIAAIGLGEWSQAGIFMVNVCVSGFFAGALIIGFQGRRERIGRRDTSILLLAVWIVLPAVSAFPLFAVGGFQRLDQAMFEAVSGLTTTGATTLSELSLVPKSVIFWRALLQWFGGAMTLLSAVLVLAPFGMLSTPMNITIPGYERDDLAKSVLATARHILPTYALLTLTCVILLWATGLPTFDALCIALSTLSTGGFMPADGGLAQYDSALAEFVIAIFMIVGATSFLAHRAALLRVAGSHSDNQETWYLAFLVLVAGGVLSALLANAQALGEGAGTVSGIEALRYGFFRAVSLITTTGFENAAPGAAGVPFACVLALCAIGGASFSTAGGLKVFRAFSMVTQAHRELKRLIHPRGITKAHSTGKPIDIQIMKTIWSMFFVFLVAMAAVSVALGAEGVPVEQAVMAAMSSLTNTGPAVLMTAIDAAEGQADVYGTLSPFAVLVLSGAMILGRIEFLVMLSLGLMIFDER